VVEIVGSLTTRAAVRDAHARGTLACGTVDSWLIWVSTRLCGSGTHAAHHVQNLTGGVHVTDVSNASRTMLLSLHTLDWDDELCK
jgi:glycerol kinase